MSTILVGIIPTIGLLGTARIIIIITTHLIALHILIMAIIHGMAMVTITHGMVGTTPLITTDLIAIIAIMIMLMELEEQEITTEEHLDTVEDRYKELLVQEQQEVPQDLNEQITQTLLEILEG